VTPAVRERIAAIPAEHRPLFDRMAAVADAAHPEADVVLSYDMPTWAVGKARLHVGVWAHGISVYGWDEARAAPFLERHPKLRTSTGTIRIGVGDDVTDADLAVLVAASLDR
jgi:uncharacterized protein YdhG (YjbR/CyaY superfamily)